MLNINIPVYNSEKTIARTLHSLLAQTNKKFIVTILDDCSTDSTLDIVRQFQNQLKIRIVENPINLGVGMMRQLAINLNECEYICFLDSDDMFLPYTVALYYREMANGFPQVLYTDFISEQKGKEVLLQGDKHITWFHGKCYRADFLEKFNITIPTVRYNEDSGFSTAVHELADNKAYVPEITYYWTENPNSITRNSEDFKLKSMADFTRSIHYAFKTISPHIEVQSLPVFYGQLNNMYCYFMKTLYKEEDNVDFKLAVEDFLNDFWIEEKIRPNLLLFGLSQASPLKGELIMNKYSFIDWLNSLLNKDYTIQDFRLEEK